MISARLEVPDDLRPVLQGFVDRLLIEVRKPSRTKPDWDELTRKVALDLANARPPFATRVRRASWLVLPALQKVAETLGRSKKPFAPSEVIHATARLLRLPMGDL